MKWLNLPVELLRSQPYSGASSEEVGIWTRLMLYCCEQENEGIILDCSDWSDRQWATCAGVTKAEIATPSKLWATRSNGSIRVIGFPHEKLSEINAKRRAGKHTAALRWKKKIVRISRVENSSVNSSATSSAYAERKGMERNGTNPTSKEVDLHAPDSRHEDLPPLAQHGLG